MTDEEKAALARQIAQEIAALRQEIATLEVLTQPIAPDDALGRVSRMDAINNRSINEAALRAARKKMKQLEQSAKQVDRPLFGRCVRCGHAIPSGRLRLMPHTTRCVACAAAG